MADLVLSDGGPLPTLTQPCPTLIYFDSSNKSSVDSDGDSSAGTEDSAWPEDSDGCASSIVNIPTPRCPGRLQR